MDTHIHIQTFWQASVQTSFQAGLSPIQRCVDVLKELVHLVLQIKQFEEWTGS